MNTHLSPLNREGMLMGQIPARYHQMTETELYQRADAARKALGNQLVILAHHYVQDSVFQLNDVAGDSLFLAREAAKTPAKYIVFCGVHFMAESADIITTDDKITMLPQLSAGCSMADMADIDSVENCWHQLVDACGEDAFIPITYINSPATLKAFCGKHGGTVCTSSNSSKILGWALEQDKKVLFFPDQRLGRNTANDLSVPSDKIKVWERTRPDGTLTANELRQSQVVLWSGYCAVHDRFTVSQIEQARQKRPDVQVIVHPECREEVVNAADYSGSTDHILRVIGEAKPGTNWAVGTEFNMVKRLANDLLVKEGKKIENLNPSASICSTMYSIYLSNVVWVLENLLEEKPVNTVSVAPDIKEQARIALDRMLDLS